MPRQAADGEAQDAPFVRHSRFGEPVAQGRLGIGNALLQRLAEACRGRLARAPERAGGMQVELCQARIAAFLRSGGEEAAAIGEGQQVADLGLVPGAGGYPFGQHPVEQEAAAGR
ncbi:hypothetical protein D9M68_330090 [compost metagenome]